MTAITLERLTKRFGATKAVDEVDLTIDAGELFFLLGPSGCGKTTLLRMIAGFTEPTRGAVLFDDRDITGLRPNRRNTGMVFQSYALWPHMTVTENVAYGLAVRKIPPPERKQRIDAALAAVHMYDYANRKPNQLSGGQQQRVALARALVVEPTVLLLDEPLSNLDAKLRLEMRSEIRRICTESGITTVYVTHDQQEALSMADRVAVIAEGRIAQLGPPREIYDRPASRFVAAFLGTTNFIPAVIKGTKGNTVELETSAGTLRSTAGMTTAPRGGAVTCSLRPEALRIVQRPDGDNNLVGTRQRSTYLGGICQHHIELPDGLILTATELNPRPMAGTGERINLAVNAADIVILSD